MTTARNSQIMQTIPLLIAICLISFPALAKYGGGTGEPNDPYRIATAENLILLGKSPEDYDKQFILTADIDLDPNLPGRKVFDKAVIALDTNDTERGFQGTPFAGVFDGNDHTISHMTINGTCQLGLFGQLEFMAEIKNLGVLDVNITGSDHYIGGLVGISNGAVNHCYSTGKVRGEDEVGGLVGDNYGDIINCYSTGTVSGAMDVGGLVGDNTRWGVITNSHNISDVNGSWNVGGLVGGNGGFVIHCYNTGAVSGNECVGGLVGLNENKSSVDNCYSTGKVSGPSWASFQPVISSYVGGLVGKNKGSVVNCYSTGSTSGGNNVGGLVGYNSGDVTACFWDIQSSGQATSFWGTGLTTAEMQTASTFLDAGWDFVNETENGTEDIWWIDEGLDYPHLWWEAHKYGGGTGEPNNPYLIYTAEQLNTIGLNQEDADKHFRLMADIDLSAYQGDTFNRIGFYEPPQEVPDWHPPFAGVFDGNGHTISNFTYVVDVNDPPTRGFWGDEDVGLFGYVNGPKAQIKNLGLIDPNIYPATTCTERVAAVGALVGSLYKGSLTNCYVKGGKVSADMTVGGLVGSNVEGTISNCYTTCSVTWASGRWLRPIDVPWLETGLSFGGLAGGNRGQIHNCYATGNVNGNGSCGGLVGTNSADILNPKLDFGFISDSYATGDVSGDEDVGGLVGNNSGEIHQCRAFGNVSGLKSVGGLVGDMIIDESSISDSYATGDVSGNEQVGGLVGYSNGFIQDSYAISEVSGTVYVGGLTGFNGTGTINCSYAGGKFSGIENVGGLVGRNGAGTINCSYAIGEVLGTEYVGGLAGTNFGTIHCSYSAGAVSGIQKVGGLVGDNWGGGIVTTCFWDIEMSGLTDMCGIESSSATGCDNSYGKTTIEMQTASTFLDAGWDFVDETENGTEDIWCIDEGLDYPRLWWELIEDDSPMFAED